MKRLAWIIPASLLLAAAFFVPKLLLSAQIQGYTQGSSSVAAPPAIEQTQGDSLIDKLRLLSDTNAQYLPFTRHMDDDSREIKLAFFQQLDRLHALNAINDSMRGMFFSEESVSVNDYYVIIPSSGKILFLHEIYDPQTDSIALYDPHSDKIFGLSFGNSVEYPLSSDALQSEAGQMLSAWAEYYSLSAGEFVWNAGAERTDPPEQDKASDSPRYLASCALTDADGQRVGFSLRAEPFSLNGVSVHISWKILSAEQLDSLETSAISAALEDESAP